jgi:type IV pilus biogenesis protein CpaD/CtpE
MPERGIDRSCPEKPNQLGRLSGSSGITSTGRESIRALTSRKCACIKEVAPTPSGSVRDLGVQAIEVIVEGKLAASGVTHSEGRVAEGDAVEVEAVCATFTK